MKKRGVDRLVCQSLLIIGAFTLLASADDTFDKLMSSGSYSEAAKYAESSIPAAARTAETWAAIGLANEKIGSTDKALACYMVSLRLGSNYDALLGAARLNNNRKQPEIAVDFAKKAMAVKMTGEACWEYARACIDLGRPAEAKSALVRVVQTDPSNKVASRELGLLLYKDKNYKDALPLLKTIMATNGTPETAVMIATCCRALNLPDSAIVYLKIASRDPGLAKGSVGLELARIHFAQANYGASADDYGTIDQSLLTAADLYQYATSLEKSSGSNDAAMRLYSAAAAKFGSSTQKEAVTAHEQYGRYCLQKKSYSEALPHLLFIYSVDPHGKIVKNIGFMVAEAQIGLGYREKAIPYLEAIIAADPHNVEAYARLADIYTAMGRTDKARAVQEKLVDLQPNNPKIQIELGNFSLRTKRYTEALRYFQKSLILEPTAAAAQGMTEAAWQLKQYDVARDAAEAALHYDSTLIGPQRILASIYINDKNYQGARLLLEKIVKSSPSDKDAWNELALCYEKTNDQKNLAQADKTIMSIDKADVASRVRFARYCVASNDLQAALATYKELMTLTPRDPSVVKNLADISVKLGDGNGAVLYLSKYVAMVPSDAVAQKDLGNLLYERKDNAGALAAYRAALKADPTIKGFFKRYAELTIAQKAPDQEEVAVLSAAVKAGEANETVYFTLGGLYQKQALYPQAIDMYQQTLLANPKNFEALSAMAACQAKSGKSSAAIVSYEQALALEPGNAAEQKALGDLYLKEGKKGQAIAAYMRYLEKAPADSRIARLVGDYEFDQKNFKDAATYLAKVTGDESGKPDFLFEYGTACYQLGDYNKTEELFKRLIALTPTDPAPFQTLYDVAKKKNDLQAAAGYLKKYTVLKPGDDKALIALGDLLYSLKEKQGSLAAYRAALKANPSAKGFYATYVTLVTEQGTTQELVVALNGAIAAGEATVAMYARLGEIYKGAGNYPKAMEMYEKASQLDPKNGALLASLADCQAKNGNADAAVVSYEQAIAMNPELNKEYKTLGDLYMKFKKTESAVRSYKKYLEKNADNGLAKFVGEQALAQKNYLEAVKYFGMVGGDDAKAPQFMLMYGNTCYLAKEDAKAIQIYKQLAVTMPQNAEVFNTLYELSLRSGTKDEALTYLKKYAELKPQDALAQRTLGDLLYDKKDQAGALAAYRALVKADPAAKGFYKRYAELVIAQGKEEEIVPVLSAAIAAGEADVGMYTQLGNIYKKQGQYAKATEMFEKASSLDTKNPALLSSLADCQLKNKNSVAAALTYEQAVALNPDAASAEYKALGDIYLSQNKTELAIKAYKQYLAKNPADGKLAKFVGEQEFAAKNYPEAKKYLGMVTGPDAKTPQFLDTYAKACYAANDLPVALTLYQQLAALNPNNADVFKTICEISAKLGKSDEEITYLKRYTALKPTDADAQKMLGDMLYGKKDSTGALAAYQAALKANPQLKGFYKNYVALVLAVGKAEDRIPALNGAIAAGEADGPMYAVLADLYRKAGDYQKAMPLYSKALDADAKNTALLFNLADCQAKTGKIMEATLSYEQALGMNPAEVKEYKTLGELYMQQKKNDEGLAAYRKYLEKFPNDARIAKIVGKAAFAVNKYDEAYKYDGLVGNDATPEFLAEYGLSAVQTNNLSTAITVLEKLRTTPGDIGTLRATAYKALAAAYEKSGNARKAAEVLNSYVMLPGVKDPDAAYSRAVVYESINPAQALTMFEANCKAYPNDYRNFYKLGTAYAKEPATATRGIVCFEQSTKLTDTVPQVWFELGLLYGAANNRDAMLKAFKKYFQLDQKNGDVIQKIGETLLSKGMAEAAVPFLEAANTLKPNDPRTMGLLARAYILTKKRDDAAKVIEKIAKVTDGNINDSLRMVLVDVYFDGGNYEQAIGELTKLLAKKSTNPLLLKLAKAYYNVGKYPEATKTVGDIKSTEPENLEAIMLLGKIQLAEKKHVEAIETFREVLLSNPSYAPAMIDLANVYMDQSRLQFANQYFERALKADSNNVAAHLGLAKIAKVGNDLATYKAELDKAKTIDPQNPEVVKEINGK